MPKKKTMLLIRPKAFTVGYGSLAYVSHLRGVRGGWMNVALPTVAAMTPKEHFEIRIMDENVERIDFSQKWDIVGLTGFATEAGRASVIARRFKENGSLIISGGPSVSLSPDMWAPFSDVLIVGEAERIWPKFVEDYLAGNHKARYEDTEKFDITDSPIPDYSGYTKEAIRQFHGGVVQTSRGCPFSCEFCDVIVYVGRKMRHKAIDRVITEIQQLYDMGLRVIFLADDNFGAARKKAKAILQAIAEWNHSVDQPVSFATQLSIDLAKDEEFLKLAAEAGLTRVFIGIETFNKESLKEVSKFHNVKSNMVDDIRKFSEYGITIMGGCIVGFDHDHLDVFERQFRFYQKANVASPFVFPLQAPDGTPLKARMIKEGRYVKNENLDHAPGTLGRLFGGQYTVIPKNMSLSQLQDGTYWLAWNINKTANTAKRLAGFFDHYDFGPNAGKLNIPKPRANRTAVGTVLRIFKYYLQDAPADEKVIMRQMIARALRSKHPQALALTLSTFVLAKNSQLVLDREVPHIRTIDCPSFRPVDLDRQRFPLAMPSEVEAPAAVA